MRKSQPVNKNCLSITLLPLLILLWLLPRTVFSAPELKSHREQLQSTWQSQSQPVNTETRLWDKTPINIILPVAQEKLVHFPGRIVFNSPQPNSALTQDKLSVLNNQGTLYLTAHKAFEPIRVTVTLVSSGEVLLLDLSANNDTNSHNTHSATNTAMNILLAKSVQSHNDIDNHGNTPNTQSKVNHTSTNYKPILDYAALTRYVLQQRYAPVRLRKVNPEIITIPLRSARTAPGLFSKFDNNTEHAELNELIITAMPIQAWQYRQFYVTEIALRNRSENPLEIPLENLCGQWLASSVYPSTPSSLVLISTVPFMEALAGCE
jgi:integrating conjugative element protein (TIGR03749 family)